MVDCGNYGDIANLGRVIAERFVVDTRATWISGLREFKRVWSFRKDDIFDRSILGGRKDDEKAKEKCYTFNQML